MSDHDGGLPKMVHTPRTYAERRAFEHWWDEQVAKGYVRNGRPPEPRNVTTQPRPSIVGTRPSTPDDECVKTTFTPGEDSVF